MPGEIRRGPCIELARTVYKVAVLWLDNRPPELFAGAGLYTEYVNFILSFTSLDREYRPGSPQPGYSAPVPFLSPKNLRGIFLGKP